MSYSSQLRLPFRLSVLATAVVGTLSVAYAAEQAAPAPDTSAAIQVVGQAARIKKALDVQTNADNIISVVHADGIGALPDTNVAEALQRVPGVSIERDQGEGRYVRIRGLGPDLNGVTVNGATLPSPESGRRAVMLDVIPTPLIRSLEVQKSLTPDQDGNSIGGSVEIKTVSAFDYPGRFMSFALHGSHDDHTGSNSPKLDATFSQRFAEGKLGFAAGISWEKREFGSSNVETGGNWDLSKAAPLLEKFEQREYSISRERLGGAFNLEYRPQAGERYYLTGLLTRFTDVEDRQSTIISFSKPQAAGASGDAKISRALKVREETQEIASFSAGLERKFDVWKLAAAVGLSQSSETEPEYLSGVEFAGKSTFKNVGFNQSDKPALFAPASVFDANQFALSKAKAPQTDAEDREHNVRFDLSRTFGDGDNSFELKFGGKLSRREKEFDGTEWAFKSLNKAPASLSAKQLELATYSNGRVDWALGELGPRMDGSAITSLFAGIPRASYLDKSASQIDDYRIKEDIDAAYIQGTYDFGATRVLAGVRYEGTRQTLNGTGDEGGKFVPSNTDNSYSHWLPAVHLRQDFDDKTSLRAAYTHSVVRPTFEQIRPGFFIDDGEAEFGNPKLNPMESRNFDLGIERRLGKASTVSAYVFHKAIKNFIYNTDVAGTGKWLDFDSAATFANGDDAKVYGLELNASYAFDNGFLIAANATLLDSSASIGRYDPASKSIRSRSIPLPSASERSANLVLGYETGPFSVRLAANYKSEYLTEVGDVLDARRDSYVAAQTQYDLSASYRINKSFQVVFEALNLNDEPYYVYLGEKARNQQYEQYGRTYKVGLKFSMD